jgi:hypothetical protein
VSEYCALGPHGVIKWKNWADWDTNRLFGFLLGATTAGAGMYYYVIDEYRVSNELLTEDIYVRSPNNLVFTLFQV